VRLLTLSFGNNAEYTVVEKDDAVLHLLPAAYDFTCAEVCLARTCHALLTLWQVSSQDTMKLQ
jgi:hypothetical protein